MEYISINFRLKNLNSVDFYKYVEKYSGKIHELRQKYGSVGLECQNTIQATLIASEFDYMIFQRSVLESQIHREIASNFSGRILLEMNRNMDEKIVQDFIKSVSVRHDYIGVDKLGGICRKSSLGNTDVGILIERTDADFFDLNKYKYVYARKNFEEHKNKVEVRASDVLEIKYLAEKIKER